MRNIITIGLLCLSLPVFSQRFTTSIGTGLGGKLEEKFPDCSGASSKGRVMGHVTQFYSVNSRYQIGLQGILSGRLSSMVGAASGPCQEYEAGSNTRKLSSNNMDANSVLLRNRLLLSPSRKNSFYIDLGVGLTSYSSGSVTADEGKVRKTSFAVSPQVGFMIRRFDISALMILGGQTPSFQGFDSFSNTNVSLTSIKSQQFYITFSYGVFRF